MKLSEIREILEAEFIVGHEAPDVDVEIGVASDMMSELFVHSVEGGLLLTGLTTAQVVRASVIAGIVAIVLVRGQCPDAAMSEQARDYGLALLSTPLTTHASCERLSHKGFRVYQ